MKIEVIRQESLFSYMNQRTCQIARICWFTVEKYMQLSWKIEFMCESLETTSEVTDDQEKIIDSFNKINWWKHVGSL